MKKISALLLFVLTTAPGIAQRSDSRIWTSFKFDQRINNDFSIIAEQAWRFENGGLFSEETFTELEIEKEFTKEFRASVAYRYGQQPTFLNSDHIFHRINLDFSYRKEWDDYRFTFRTRLQRRYRDVNRSEDGHIPLSYNRNKLNVQRAMSKKVSIDAGAEIFYRFYYTGNKFDRYRFSLGMDIELSKRFELQSALLFQKEINSPNPERSIIYNLGLRYQPRRIKTG